MEKIVWTEDFSVGNSLMNEQHKLLIAMINDIADTDDASKIFDVIMKMFNYAAEHFTAEEDLMRLNSFAGLDDHIIEHQSFGDKAAALAASDYFDDATQVEIFTYLREWLTHHILESDMAYKGCF